MGHLRWLSFMQAVAAVEEKKSAKTQREPSQYELYTFTTWLLRARFCKLFYCHATTSCHFMNIA